MIGRQVAIVLRFPAHARLPIRSAPLIQCYQDRAAFSTHRRLLDDTVTTTPTPARRPGRPRKAVGEPSRPVKRSIKRAVPKATSDSPAAEKVAGRKKDAAAKKTVVKTKPAKKELTEKQKEAKKATLAKEQITELKKAALDPPKISYASAWNQFTSEKMSPLIKGVKDVRTALPDAIKRTAQDWKELSSADIEHYNHLAHTTKEQSQAEYKRWVESHTPEEIEAANHARVLLRRRTPHKKNSKQQWPAIHDERAVKRGMSSWMQFNVNRHASGDFKNIPLGERSKLISKEWKALSEGEKEKYKKLENADKDRYINEYSSVFGHAPPSYMNGAQQQTATASA